MNLKQEIFIYLMLAGILMAVRRVISGMKNGCFYAKGSVPYPAQLEKYIKNIHYLETPAWYTQFGALFLLLLAAFRALNPTCYWYHAGAAMMATMGSSALAGFWFQGYINVGSKRSFSDRFESKVTEFAWGPIRFWRPKLAYGKRRFFASIAGLIMMAVGFYLGLR